MNSKTWACRQLEFCIKNVKKKTKEVSTKVLETFKQFIRNIHDDP